MGMDAWTAPAIEALLCLVFGCWRCALKLALRIEAFENEAAVVAEQLLHTYCAEKDTGIVKIPLYPLALAPWALHAGPFYNDARVKMRKVK
jgi:hypothetical protein